LGCAGEPLFPELKPLDFLLERKSVQSLASWQAEYQQNPIVVGGGTFPIEKLPALPYLDRKTIKRSVRYFDKAATVSKSAAYTAGVLMHMLNDGNFVVESFRARLRGKPCDRTGSRRPMAPEVHVVMRFRLFEFKNWLSGGEWVSWPICDHPCQR
jgi:hypothetical protein